MPNLENIPVLVSDNQIALALQLMADAADSRPDFFNEVLLLQNRWVDFRARQTRGVLSFEEENLQHAKIVSALLELAERMNGQAADAFLPPLAILKRPWHKILWLFAALAIGAGLFYLSGFFQGATFEFTINLKPKPGIDLSPTYPPVKNARLILHLANESKPAEVKALSSYTGEADFKNIASNYRGQLVEAELVDASGRNQPIYWRLALDSVRLDGKNQTLWIIPDNSLAHIRGNVRDAHDNQPLAGVVLETAGIVDTSDSHGLFHFSIPPMLQQMEYPVNARKPGYRAITRSVTPATVPDLPILLPRSDGQ